MNKKNNTEEKAQENADRLRKNKRMLRNLRFIKGVKYETILYFIELEGGKE